MDLITSISDLSDEKEICAYFAYLEREYPQLIEAMRVMNISYEQYLTALRAMSPRRVFSSSNSTGLTLQDMPGLTWDRILHDLTCVGLELGRDNLLKLSSSTSCPPLEWAIEGVN